MNDIETACVIDSIPPKSYNKKKEPERDRAQKKTEDQIKSSLSSPFITIYFSDYINDEQEKIPRRSQILG
jgi:hypothetical protein